MKKPIIFSVDDDPQVLRSIGRDLKSKYRSEYKVLSTISANEALEALLELKQKGDTVALLLSDQRMPEMLGVEFLEKAKEVFPEAKRVLLTAYSDISAAIKAINDVQLDYYLLKPWDPPEEKLYPVLDDLLFDWRMSFVPDFEGIKVLGYQYSPKSHKIRDFLSGNLLPFQFLDIEKDKKAKELLELHHLEEKQLPAVILESGEVLQNPENREIAEHTGRTGKATQKVYDVVIIGAGPSGLAAAVYGASEGLNTLLIEKRAPGGQAGTSSRIENYLGFPSGLSGSDLARRAITQAERFGTEFLSPQVVTEMRQQDQYKILTLEDGSEINAKAVVVTTGVDYRKLPAPGIEKLTGAGVYYGAAMTEAAACKNQDVYIVGGGNSAGQGAVYLAKYARAVYIMIRKDSLSYSMSQYLIDQIDQIENIHLLPETEIVEAHGNENLEELTIRDRKSGGEKKVPAGALFIFIGAKPYTDWVPEMVLRNHRDYILTGRDMIKRPDYKVFWKLEREPFLLETSLPGVFAAGDVRAGAMNRVASAVGEGAMTIKFVHEYLAEQ